MYKPEGIFHITGEVDSGKTLLALGAYHPKDTAYFLDDVKKPPVTQFAYYCDVGQKYNSLKVLELYHALMKEIDNLPQVDCIVFDTWARFGKAIRYYAKANPYEFREQSTFAPNGTIRNMEQWGQTHVVEADIIAKLSQKCKALFLITHIKEKMIAGVKSGLYEPDCGKSFDRVCNMRLWLRHNEKSGVPIALVLKRISKATITDNGLEILNVLPRRIEPQSNDTSLWQTISRYWDNPFGNREPEQHEKPTEFELGILDGVLTNDMREVWRAEIREKERQEKEAAEFFNNQYQEAANYAKELLTKHYPDNPPPIAFIPANIKAAMYKEFSEKYEFNEKEWSEML